LNTWFTADLHLGHARIIELCDRPFRDPADMNETIIQKWNERVAPEDQVYVLGDVALGTLSESLPLVARLAVTTGVTVPLMTWVVMPRVTRLLHRWLYPERGAARHFR